jgi:sugar/nucleoside kinase (ribokinase family)
VTHGGRFDCAVVGTCVADILVRPVPLGEPVGGGRLLHVDPIEVTTGGLVCTTGIGLARLGLAVAAGSLVGTDPWGDLVRARLDRERLDTASLEAVPGLATSTTAVLIDPSGERSFAHHVGACAALDVAWIRRQLPALRRAEWVIIGYAGLLPALEPEFAEAVAAIRAAGCRVALETGGSGGSLAHVGPALPEVDLYVPSLDEAAAQTGRDDPRAILERLRELGAAGIVGVKLGSRGTLLSPAAGEVHEIPCVAAPGPVVDTTGAGDALVAGLLAGIIRGMQPREACLLGAANAACCVTAAGATSGLRSFEETLALAERSGRR